MAEHHKLMKFLLLLIQPDNKKRPTITQVLEEIDKCISENQEVRCSGENKENSVTKNSKNPNRKQPNDRILGWLSLIHI